MWPCIQLSMNHRYFKLFSGFPANQEKRKNGIPAGRKTGIMLNHSRSGEKRDYPSINKSMVLPQTIKQEIQAEFYVADVLLKLIG